MKLSNWASSLKLLAAILTSTFVLASCASQGESGNQLDIGHNAKAPDSVDIALQGLMDYNGKTAEQVLAIRSKHVNTHPELVLGTYTPAAPVFAMDSKSPWWSQKGYIFRDVGGVAPKTEGVSRESAYLGNPFLLVGAEWYGSSMIPPRNRFPTDADFGKVFPTYLPPSSVKIFAKEKREEITYDVMTYYNTLRSMLNDWPITNLGFDLHAYNAKDFGFNYIYIEAGASTNLNKYPSEVIDNTQTLAVRTKKTCAESCNDVIDTPDSFEGFRLNMLPAKCHMLLWRTKPSSHLVTPDFKVDLIFK